MASIIGQVRSSLGTMKKKFQDLSALAGKDAEGTGKALKKCQTTLNNMAKQAGEQAAAAGALVAHSKAGDSHKLVEKANAAKTKAEEAAGRINTFLTDLEEVQAFYRDAAKAAEDTAGRL